MSVQKKFAPVMILGIFFLFSSGCMEYSFGELRYNDSNLTVQISNNGNDIDATVQITVYSLDNFRQTDYAKYVKSVNLKHGVHEYTFPAELSEGNYKLYLYVLVDKKRESAEIRDFIIR